MKKSKKTQVMVFFIKRPRESSLGIPGDSLGTSQSWKSGNIAK